jgi:hypothetical protein
MVERRLGHCRIAIQIMKIGRQVRVIRYKRLVVFQGCQLIILGRFEVTPRVRKHRILVIRVVLFAVSSPGLAILIWVECCPRTSYITANFTLIEAEIRPLAGLIHLICRFTLEIVI